MPHGGTGCVIHVSGDFPDPINPGKTPVIRTLLELTRAAAAHRVYSINRRSWPVSGITAQDFPDGRALTYFGPPSGILHRKMLLRLGDWLAADLAADFASTPAPDLLMGHKLTVEGIAVHRAAQKLQVPYGVSIQGNTDTKILAARPDLRREFARIFHEAAIVFPFTPWALEKVQAQLGKREGPVRLLPCPTDLDQPLPPVTGGSGLTSVFHLRNYRGKNLRNQCRAMALLRTRHPDLMLEVIGGGDPVDVARSRAVIGASDNVRLCGPLDRAQLRARLNRAVGMALPSLRETYGLAYIDALFAGTPVIYPRGAAIDGYFPDAPFAIAVDARDAHGLADAMERMVEQEAVLKQALGEWQLSDHARGFQRDAIGQNFAAGLREGCSGKPPQADRSGR